LARYSSLLGRRVEVVYRLGLIHLLAAGTLVADSGKCIFVEQRLSRPNYAKTFHLKIPYHCIIRLNGSDPDSELALI
jgi:hypothetical protein